MGGVRPALVSFAVVAALVSAGCTDSEQRAEPRPTRTTPSATSTPTPTPTYDKRSLPAMFDEDITGGDLRRVGESQDLGAYTRQEVRYRSGDLTISGLLLVPDGAGPHPAVVLNHGYIDPAVYRNGQGMPREQDYLARQGYVVLHTDYRGHAGSDNVGPVELELRLGYARDSIAAVKALRELDEVDPDKIGMLGRSVGGGVTMNALVAEPDIVKAAVIHSSVSSRFVDNFRRWTEPNRSAAGRTIVRRWGSVDDNPRFWRDLSARTHADRIEAGLLMVHGALDESCPISWARATERALTQAGADVDLVVYGREGHTFAGQWADKMRRTVDFLDERLGV
jgi:dipeptidyl aminopeptidase/acylaminoacyl peptidase